MKTLIQLYLVSCLVCLAGINSLQAQAVSGSVSQPVVTYVVDNTQHVRPLIGIPGAASIGNPVDLGFNVTQAAVPPAHDYMLAMAAGSNWPILVQVNGGSLIPQFSAFTYAPNQTACDSTDASNIRESRVSCSPPQAIDTSTSIDRVALSPTGSAAALVSSAAGRIYTFTNVSGSVTPGPQIDVSTIGSISSFGISDDGQTVAIGVSDGQNGSLFISEAGGLPRPIGPMSHPAAIAFLHNSSGAVIADDVQNSIYSLSSGQVFAIASAADGIASPIALAVSNDNGRLFVANAQAGSVSTISLGGAAAPPVYCNCTLTGLFSTNTDSVFRLTDFTGKPILLFDANRATPRIEFVPLIGSQF